MKLTYTKQELENASKTSANIKELTIKLGLTISGNNYNSIRKTAQKFDIDLSHLINLPAPQITKENLIGEKFDMLTVLERKEEKDKNGKKIYFAICKCDCGSIKKIRVQSLKSGRTTSCGCRRDQYKKTSGKNSKQFTGYEDISGRFWHKLKIDATQKRKITFDLRIEDVWNLYLAQNKQCAMTGMPIVFTLGSDPKKTTASLDRIDITKGYFIDNIQLVHKHINIMRNIYTIEHFIEMCKLVAKNN